MTHGDTEDAANQSGPFLPLIRSALDVVEAYRPHQLLRQADDSDCRIVVPAADLRLTVEQGPRTAARNIIDMAKMRASGKHYVSVVDPHRAIGEACLLLGEYVHSLAGAHGNLAVIQRQRQARAVAAMKNLLNLERML
jgi:hypothetical protein